MADILAFESLGRFEDNKTLTADQLNKMARLLEKTISLINKNVSNADLSEYAKKLLSAPLSEAPLITVSNINTAISTVYIELAKLLTKVNASDLDKIRVDINKNIQDINTINSSGTGGGGGTGGGTPVDAYTKTQTDNKLALKADKTTTNTSLDLKADKSTTYTKTATDTALALKADKTTTYTKTATDTALALKADKTTTYTKAEVDAKAGSGKFKTTENLSDVDIDNLINVKSLLTKEKIDSAIAQGGVNVIKSILIDLAFKTTELVKNLGIDDTTNGVDTLLSANKIEELLNTKLSTTAFNAQIKLITDLIDSILNTNDRVWKSAGAGSDLIFVAGTTPDLSLPLDLKTSLDQNGKAFDFDPGMHIFFKVRLGTDSTTEKNVLLEVDGSPETIQWMTGGRNITTTDVTLALKSDGTILATGFASVGTASVPITDIHISKILELRGTSSVSAVDTTNLAAKDFANVQIAAITGTDNRLAIFDRDGNISFSLTSAFATLFKGDKGEQGDRGQGLALKGTKNTVPALPTTGNVDGDVYYVKSDKNLYMWDRATSAWITVGQITGISTPGTPGIDGKPGQVGRNGRDGRDGRPGTDGTDGTDGAGIQLKGIKALIADLTPITGVTGDVWFVQENKSLYIWDTVTNSWILMDKLSIITIRGKDGVDGKPGRDGRDGVAGRDGQGINLKGVVADPAVLNTLIPTSLVGDVYYVVSNKSIYILNATKQWAFVGALSIVAAQGKDGVPGTDGIDGIDGKDGQSGWTPKGTVATLSALPTTNLSGGDAYIVDSESNWQVWNADDSKWVDGVSKTTGSAKFANRQETTTQSKAVSAIDFSNIARIPDIVDVATKNIVEHYGNRHVNEATKTFTTSDGTTIEMNRLLLAQNDDEDTLPKVREGNFENGKKIKVASTSGSILKNTGYLSQIETLLKITYEPSATKDRVFTISGSKWVLYDGYGGVLTPQDMVNRVINIKQSASGRMFRSTFSIDLDLDKYTAPTVERSFTALTPYSDYGRGTGQLYVEVTQGTGTQLILEIKAKAEIHTKEGEDGVSLFVPYVTVKTFNIDNKQILSSQINLKTWKVFNNLGGTLDPNKSYRIISPAFGTLTPSVVTAQSIKGSIVGDASESTSTNFEWVPGLDRTTFKVYRGSDGTVTNRPINTTEYIEVFE